MRGRIRAGFARSEIDEANYSVWRYAKALLVNAADAVTMGEGWTPLLILTGSGLKASERIGELLKLSARQEWRAFRPRHIF